MNSAALPLAPLGAIVAVVGWLTYAGLEPRVGPPSPRPKLSRVDPSLLAAVAVPPSTRDPFRYAGQPVDDAPPAPAAAANKPASSPVRISPRATKASTAPGGLGATVAGLSAGLERTRKGLVDGASRAAEARAALSAAVRLSATSVGGARRFATINDRVVAEGEALDAPGNLRGPVVLSRVRDGSVIVRYMGTPAVVAFSTSRPAPAAVAAAKPSKPAAAPRPKAARPRRAAGKAR